MSRFRWEPNLSFVLTKFCFYEWEKRSWNSRFLGNDWIFSESFASFGRFLVRSIMRSEFHLNPDCFIYFNDDWIVNLFNRFFTYSFSAFQRKQTDVWESERPTKSRIRTTENATFRPKNCVTYQVQHWKSKNREYFRKTIIAYFISRDPELWPKQLYIICIKRLENVNGWAVFFCPQIV